MTDLILCTVLYLSAGWLCVGRVDWLLVFVIKTFVMPFDVVMAIPYYYASGITSSYCTDKRNYNAYDLRHEIHYYAYQHA